MLPSKEFDAYMGHVKEDFTDLISFFRDYPDYFLDYIKSVGINASGDSYRITSKDISNYYF